MSNRVGLFLCCDSAFDLPPFAESFFSLSALETKLVTYISSPDGPQEPFDVTSVPKISREQLSKEGAREYVVTRTKLCLIALQVRAAWTQLAHPARRRQRPHHRLPPPRHNRNMHSNSPTCQNSRITAPYLAAARNQRSLQRAKPNTRCRVSSMCSRSIPYSR